ncbi:MAG: hypothetical protein PHQ36_11835 [Anaerolineales bacterium]|nr:hypothetical protein [Anaerolineales bacterium]
MSKYDYGDTPPAPKKKSSSLEVWDVLSIITLLFTACMILYFAAIFISPGAAYNPLKPKPTVNPFATATPTITQIQLQPTWTPTTTPEITGTPTLLPTITLEPSATPFSLLPPTKTPTPTKTPKAAFSASFEGIKSAIIHPEFGCDWQGIGGTVVDANNADMLRMTIRLTGLYNGKSINELTVSSIAPAYGKSGFEFFLGNAPTASKGALYLQLLDQAGAPLSENIYVDTFSACSQNLTLVRFVKNP